MREPLIAVALVLCACTGSIGGDPDDDKFKLPDGGQSTAAHLFCITETNRFRGIEGRPAIEHSAQLEAYANHGAMIDSSSSPHHHFISTGGGGIAFAENECPNWELAWHGGDMMTLVAACLQAFYDEGPGTGDAHGHYNNMMGDYGTLGCGIFESGAVVTIVQDYGE
ncbi:MAG: CAP domain-containing protein [Kofleriaceae bacterium]